MKEEKKDLLRNVGMLAELYVNIDKNQKLKKVLKQKLSVIDEAIDFVKKNKLYINLYEDIKLYKELKKTKARLIVLLDNISSIKKSKIKIKVDKMDKKWKKYIKKMIFLIYDDQTSIYKTMESAVSIANTYSLPKIKEWAVSTFPIYVLTSPSIIGDSLLKNVGITYKPVKPGYLFENQIVLFIKAHNMSNPDFIKDKISKICHERNIEVTLLGRPIPLPDSMFGLWLMDSNKAQLIKFDVLESTIVYKERPKKDVTIEKLRSQRLFFEQAYEALTGKKQYIRNNLNRKLESFKEEGKSKESIQLIRRLQSQYDKWLLKIKNELRNVLIKHFSI